MKNSLMENFIFCAVIDICSEADAKGLKTEHQLGDNQRRR